MKNNEPRRLRDFALATALVLFPLSAIAWTLTPAYQTGTIWSESVPTLQGVLAKSTSGKAFLAVQGHTSYLVPTNDTSFIQVVNQVFFRNVDDKVDGPLDLITEWPFTGASTWIDICADNSGTPHIVFFRDAGTNLYLTYATRQSVTSQWVISTLAGPWPANSGVRAAIALIDESPVVAFASTTEGGVHWAEMTISNTWSISSISPTGSLFVPPLDLAISPESVPVVTYIDGTNLVASYRISGSWQQELVKTGPVNDADLAFDHFGQLALVYRYGTNVQYGSRSAFGTWNFSIVTTDQGGSEVALAFSDDNVPSIAFNKSNSTLYYAQRYSPPHWQIQLVADTPCSYDNPLCFYGWKHVGQSADLTFTSYGYPLLLHRSVAGNYKVSSKELALNISHFPLNWVDWTWAYHDDADGIDERTTQPLPAQQGYYLDRKEYLDGEDIPIWLITSESFKNSAGQVWIHWWDGSSDLWTEATPQGTVQVQPHEINGQPDTSAQTVALWKGIISQSMTKPGINYYAIQLKSISPLPNGQQLIDEDWLTRDLTGGDSAMTNNLGQAITGTNDFAGHDWSVLIHADTDGDGIADEWETAYGLNPTNGADAVLDSDGDGFLNVDEYRANTNPTNGQAFFSLQSFSVDVLPAITFLGASNRVYTMQRSDALPSGVEPNVPWLPVTTQIKIPGSNAVQTMTDNSSHTGQFYRASVNLP